MTLSDPQPRFQGHDILKVKYLENDACIIFEVFDFGKLWHWSLSRYLTVASYDTDRW